MVAGLIFEMLKDIPREQRTKRISILCTDTRVEIPAIVGMIEGTLDRMRKFADAQALNMDVHLLRPPPEQSFWVNIIGRCYPPPNRHFRWCTQRMKIDPVNVFVERPLGRTGQAILHLGARRAESASRSQTMAGIELKTAFAAIQTCRAWMCPIPSSTSPPSRSGPTCCKTPRPGAAATTTFTDCTKMQVAASAPSTLIPAPRAAEIPALAAGPALSWSGTRPARACSLRGRAHGVHAGVPRTAHAHAGPGQ